jgi:hypothetical protein
MVVGWGCDSLAKPARTDLGKFGGAEVVPKGRIFVTLGGGNLVDW